MAIENGRMLYRFPGTMLSHYGNRFDYLIVEREDADKHVAQGWSLTVEQALAAATAPTAEADDESDDTPPTRAELEEQCKKLGIKVDGRYSDKRLLALIAEKMG